MTAKVSPHSEGVEQSGNMLIMTYAHARVSGDGSVAARHVRSIRRMVVSIGVTHSALQYTLLRDWADYLVNNTLELPSQ